MFSNKGLAIGMTASLDSTSDCGAEVASVSFSEDSLEIFGSDSLLVESGKYSKIHPLGGSL
jgi:hypothetical protein